MAGKMELWDEKLQVHDLGAFRNQGLVAVDGPGYEVNPILAGNVV